MRHQSGNPASLGRGLPTSPRGSSRAGLRQDQLALGEHARRSSIEGVVGNCCSFRLATPVNGRGEKGPVMALTPVRTEPVRTVGHVSHDAQARVDTRVKEILARREAALQHARRAAQRLKRPVS